MVDALLFPAFSPSAQAALRIGYGLLLVAQLLIVAPHFRRLYGSERYGGFVESSRFADRFLAPGPLAAVWGGWLLCALLLAAGTATLTVALANALLARYFFVVSRRNNLNGQGAIGRFNHWMAVCIALIELASWIDGSGRVRALVAGTFRIDLGFIMISAGLYKWLNGYAGNDGLQFALANPWLGNWSTWLRRLNPRSRGFAILNHAAYLGETAIGIGMLIPPIAPFAALALAAGFAGLGVVMRLSFLAELVVVATLLFVPAGSWFDRELARILPSALAPLSASTFTTTGAALLEAGLLVYVVALPVAHLGLFSTFYRGRTLPEPFQLLLHRWTRFFHLTIWRVVTADYITFFVRFWIVGSDGSRRPLWRSIWSDTTEALRFKHALEFVTLQGLFNGLRQAPQDQARFEQRLLRYVRSLRVQSGERVVAEYVTIRAECGSFAYRSLNEFEVDPVTGTVVERKLSGDGDCRDVPAGVRVYRTVRSELLHVIPVPRL